MLPRYRAPFLMAIIVTTGLFETGVVFCMRNEPGYQGCFWDSKPIRMFYDKFEDDNQSVELCFRHCLETEEYAYAGAYAGVEYGDECFCGTSQRYNDYQSRRKPDVECNQECTGNADQICGASKRLSVYQISSGVCTNDIGPPVNGSHRITTPSWVKQNLRDYKVFRTRIYFSCDAGFVLTGSGSIECVETGTTVGWNDSVPLCSVPIPTTTAPIPTTTSQTTQVNPQTTNATDPSTGASATAAIGIIVGIVGAILFVLLVATFGVFLWRRKRNIRSKTTDNTAVLYANKAYEVQLSQPGELQTQPGNTDPPVHSHFIRDVHSVETTCTQETTGGSAALNEDQTQWEDNVLYASETLPASGRYPPGEQPSQAASKPEADETEGWVQNNIYE